MGDATPILTGLRDTFYGAMQEPASTEGNDFL
jgi:hypothetical protein